ncbi:MAG: hypothetical protein KKB88_02675 [Nanoarchaeota archaeon]|nr:hypothetical protein [Nanoarchaeota archaeon]
MIGENKEQAPKDKTSGTKEKKEYSEDISKEIQKSVPKQEVVNLEIAEKEEKISEAVSELPITTKITEPKDEIEERKKKIINFLKNKQIWVMGVLIIALILGIYIRSLPMQDHGGTPGLWDITTNTWTLGPDLDPWLFERYAKIIVEEGSLPKIDMMRNVPLGFDMSKESMLLPRLIDWTYHILNIFMEANIELAGVIFPVIMFALTIISFFLFVREIFIKNSKKSILKANTIALISTFFMIVIPVFLSRTVAGIPEKESAAFFFMFLTFYLFLKAWKTEKIKKASILTILAGISTACMGLIWGGVMYIFIVISATNLIAFILNKINKKEFLIYTLWFFTSFSLLLLLTNKFSLISLLTSINTGLVFLVFFIMTVHFILNNTKLGNIKFLKNLKFPKTIISLIIAIVLIFFFALIFFGPDFIISKIKAIHQTMFRPVIGRWNTTVAENRQPFFTEWGSSFGPFIKNIPILFWSFIIGSIVLFRKMLNKIKNKDNWVLTGFYILFLFGMIFSRYSSSSILNGENFISKSFYYLSAILLIGVLIYYYDKYYKEGNNNFQQISYEYLFLFVLFILCLFSARGAVRLTMVLAPIAPIFVSYLIVESIDKFKKTNEETQKLFIGVFIIIILILSMFVFWNFYKTIKVQAYNFIPSYYNQQWQKAMQWVRDETPQDAVFSHWWDYGYWVQSIGNRATVLDGGNAITYWNYLMGRHVLTGDNQKNALEFLYNHNATHLLIDSSDIGKYGAYSSIGSDENYDRYSWIGVFLQDEKQTHETKNQTIYVYSGGSALDEDLIITKDDKEILLPAQQAGAGAIILSVEKKENKTTFSQPYVIMVYQGQQYQVNLRYLSISGEFVDFKSGIEAAIYVFPAMKQQGQSLTSNVLGAAMYISPRLMRGMVAQIYILDDPLKKFQNFELVHSEQNLIIDQLRNQGMNLPEFIYYQGIQGPIKIWEIEYTGEEQIREEYLDKDASKYIKWKL